MSRKQAFIKGTFILTITGFASRCIGFLQRIFLSQVFGAEGVGLYQLIFPIYALCYSLSVAGVETAISHTVSSKIAKNQKAKAQEFLLTSLGFSFVVSLIVMVLLQQWSSYISTQILADSRTSELLMIVSYALPFSTIHSCIVGYYFGCKQTSIPSISQLLEQVIRIGSIYLLYFFCIQSGRSCSIAVAVIGLIIGEVFSALFCIYCFSKSEVKFTQIQTNTKTTFIHLKELLHLSIPLTSNRVALNILQNVECISIPQMLIVYGLTSSDSLSTYGILTGMALPCILFPTAITSSISTMLLPTVAEIQATGRKKEINEVIQKCILYCTLLGLFSLISFFIFSDFIGELLFQNGEVSSFIKVLAWLSPFLYLNSTLLTIINGLGKTAYTFSLNIIGLIIRISSIFFLIPNVGIYGYLWGLLGSQIFVTIGSIYTVKQLAKL